MDTRTRQPDSRSGHPSTLRVGAATHPSIDALAPDAAKSPVEGQASQFSWRIPAIELRHLRYFLAVFDELHFGRAAVQLHIAQPPLSQAIRKLEDKLGVQLFRRTSRVVIPTEAAAVFAEHVRTILASFDVAVAEARRAGGAGTALGIGCVPDLPVGALLEFLRALEERAPGARPTVVHLPGHEQVLRLKQGSLDVGVFHDVRPHPGLETERLFAGEPVAAFLAYGHPLAKRQVLRPEDLRDETLLAFPRACDPTVYGEWLTRLEHGGYEFRDVREAAGCGSRDLLFGVATSGCVALGAVSLADVSEAGSIVVRRPLDPPLAMPDTVVAWSSAPPRLLRPELDVIRDIARTLLRD